MPRGTMVFVLLTSLLSLGLVIASLAMDGTFNGKVFRYLSLTPSLVYEKGEAWRLISCYFVNNSFWSIIYIGLGLYFVGAGYEAQLGTKRYVLTVLVALVVNSIFESIFAAFFGLIPKINSVGYFADQWFDYTPIGSTPLLIIAQIFEIRGNRRKEVMCCCFEMPWWAYIIVLFIMAQLMMYPPWYGLFYNLSAIIIGFATPRKWIQPPQEMNTKSPYNMQAIQQNQNQQPETIHFTTINGRTQEPPRGEKMANKVSAKWGSSARKL